jgi:hypothetical protein
MKGRKRTPEEMAELGRAGGLATKKKKGSKWFAKIAAKSHPRESYTPGPGRPRKKKDVAEVADSNGTGDRTGN